MYAEDSGEYICRAVNDFGEDLTKATIACKRERYSTDHIHIVYRNIFNFFPFSFFV